MDAQKKYHSPTKIEDAVSLAKKLGSGFKFLAGGTDIIPNKYQGNTPEGILIDLTNIKELEQVIEIDEYLKVGALVKLDDLKKHSQIVNKFPQLIEAAESVGSPLIRKTATIGGNILCENRCLFYNQSDWWKEAVGFCLKCDGDVCIATGGKKACFSEAVSDTAPYLISIGCKLEILNNEGMRQVDLQSIYTGDGVRPLNLKASDLVTALLLPTEKDFKVIFKKLRQRNSLEFTSLTSCVAIDNENNINICLSGVDPKPVTIEGSINDDLEELIKKAIKGSRTVDNDVFSRGYRRDIIREYLQESFKLLLS